MRTRWRGLATCAGCAVLAVGGAPAASAGPAAGDPWLLYVANTASGSVSVIDTSTHAVVATIPVGGHPVTVSVSADGTAAHVTDRDGTTHVIDTFTNAVAGPARTTGGAGAARATGGAGQSTATTPDGRTSYLADPAHDLVDVVDTRTRNVVATISGVGDGPCAVAISPDGATAYVANANSGTVAAIDTASDSVMEIVPVGRHPSGLAVTPDQAPFAALTVTPAPAGQATTLDASGSTVRFGAIATYAWSFGDGTAAVTVVPTTTHAYRSPGRYPLTLTVTSTGGTSTGLVHSGRALIRNGGPGARVARTVAIPAFAYDDTGGLPITGTALWPAVALGLLLVAVGTGLVRLGGRNL